VDLNMVRSGVVPHPERWARCGHDELAGHRTRYRILDLEGLATRLGLPTVEALRELYQEAPIWALREAGTCYSPILDPKCGV
jgi:putative transposase